MPEGSTERRLDRIETRQDAMLETLAVIREKVTQTNGNVDDVLAEIGRVPAVEVRGTRLPITDRLHNIEAVVTPTAMEAAVHSALDKRRSHAWTAWQKSALFLIALLGGITSLLRFLGHGG